MPTNCLLALAAVVSLCCASNAESRSPPVVHGIAYVRYLGQGRSDLWLAVDGGRRRLIAHHASRPLLSPDGRWIAFAKCIAADYCGDVVLASTRGNERRLLARGLEVAAWAPDSTHLFGMRRLRGYARRALIRVDVRTGHVTHLVGRAVERFSVSPSGREVCVEIAPRGASDLYVVDADGRSLRRRTHGGVSDFPVWGARGIAFRRLVRHGRLPHHAWGADEIWRIAPDGRGARRLAQPPARILGSGITGLAPVAWSRDGKRIVAALTNEFGGPPYAVNTRTGAVRRIDSYGYAAWAFGLSTDGTRILVEERRYDRLDRTQRVEVVPFAGGSPKVIARFAGEPAWNR